MTDSSRAERLLILDDDLAVATTIGFVAEAAGLSYRATSHADEFFRLLEAWQPSVLVLDLILPDMDGIEVMRRLAERGVRAQIIITSGVGERVLDAARRSAAARDLNILGVLPKPFPPAVLTALLHGMEPVFGAPGGRAAVPGADVTQAELRHACEHDELQLVYQPKIDCESRALSGFEALARWHHPRAGLVMPNDFIPLAESCGLIDRLTDLLLNQALRWFAACHRDTSFCLSFNLSARSLSDLLLPDRLDTLCGSLGVAPSRVILELTETSAMDDPIASLELLTRLRMKGFQLSIDDFGTGYSSMVQLVRLPFSELKVDKSFVMPAMQSAEARAVIKSVVDLGRSLGLRVTAEGVEHAETLHYLRGIHCHQAQGYYVSRPIAGEAAAAWTADGARAPARA